MHPDNTMKRIIDGKRYTVATATLLASDEYWDGSSWERSGRNTFLYRTRGGAFFVVSLSQWQGERDTIEPVSKARAMELYEDLENHLVEYEQAFDAVAEEPTAGRPPLYNGEAMKTTAVWMPVSMLDWLREQPGGISATLRSLVEREMAG